jgi:hypothetical protein
MPLVKGKSEKAFKKNVETEMHAGKPQNQSLAIAYSMKRKAKKMAQGGDSSDDQETLGSKIGYPGSPKPKPSPQGYAEGGAVKSKRERAMDAFRMAMGGIPELTHSGEQSSGKPEIDGDLEPEAHLHEELAEHIHHEPTHDSHVGHDVMNQEGDEDEGAGDMDSIHPMVMRIMMGRAKGYSEGGKVANEESGESTDEPTMAKADGNEFDDLALRDDLEFKDTGANSGDELDDAQENHDREDIVSRIMKSRAKKDRMPSPA